MRSRSLTTVAVAGLLTLYIVPPPVEPIASSTPETASGVSAFERATTVHPLGDGRYAGRVDPGWSAPTGPNGGYLAAIAVRALQAHLDPTGELRLRSLGCHYLRPAAEGDIELEVELVRSGRRLSTGRLTAWQEGREVLIALAAFSVTDLAAAGTWAPPLPDVEPAPSPGAESLPLDRYAPGAGGWLEATVDMPPIVHRVKVAPRRGGVPFSGRELEPGEAPETGGWIGLAEPHALDAAYIALCTDVWWPPALEPLSRPAIAPTIDLTIHLRADIPAAGLPYEPVLGWYRSTAAIGGLMEEDGVLFLGDGTLLAQSRQLALLAPL